MSTQKKLMTNWRWWICGLLFVATTVNYLDRQVLSLTAKEFIYPEFGWDDDCYGTITAWFSIFYAFFMLFAGKFVDWMGTKKGYLWAIGIWSAGACLHALCGIGTQAIVGQPLADALATGGEVATLVGTVSVWLFLAARAILGLGEAGNFPAAIKVTAEYFPKKDRSFATSIFNSGASVGALIAPLCIPPLAKYCGWEWAFVIIGALGFIWMGFFVFMYDKPEKSKHVNKAELEYIHQDDANATETTTDTANEGKPISLWKAFTYRQTWAFIVGKFFTDGVWWFFLFWAPGYFQDIYGYKASSGTGMLLIMTLYAIVTFLSIALCKLPTHYMNKGMEAYSGRMRAMFLFALLPLVCIAAQPSGNITAWLPAILIGLVGAGHQAWSANLFSTIGDMFPKSAIATITGIGGMAGGLGSFLINKLSGKLFSKAAGHFQYTNVKGIVDKGEITASGLEKATTLGQINPQMDSSWEYYNTTLSSIHMPDAKSKALLESLQEAGVNTDLGLSNMATDGITHMNQLTTELVAKTQELGFEVIDQPMQALGFFGKPAGYMIVFCVCAVAYILAWVIMKVLVPKYKAIK